jgi:hypothetical protein
VFLKLSQLRFSSIFTCISNPTRPQWLSGYIHNTSIAHRFCRPQRLTLFSLLIEGLDMVRTYTRKPKFLCPKCRITNFQAATNVDLSQIFRLYANHNLNKEQRIVGSGCSLPHVFDSVRLMTSSFLHGDPISRYFPIYYRGCF